MSRRRTLNDEQIGRMADMRERGRSCAAIAAWFTNHGTPVSKDIIRWQCLRVGAFRPGPPSASLGRIPARGRPFTPVEDQRLLAMREAGRGVNDIGRALGRKHNSVIARLLALASYDALREAA